MSSRWLRNGALAVGMLVIVGVSAGIAESRGLLPSGLDKALSIAKDALSLDYMQQLTRGSGDCDKSATTTDCSKVVQKQPLPGGAINITPSVPYGALKNIFTDPKYGFSLKYPDELALINGGDVQLVDSRNEKAFSLKICNPESPCGRELSNASVSSVEEVQRKYVASQYGSEGVLYREEFSPLSNTVIRTDNGASILKQSYSTVIRDSVGVDVTSRECEACVGQKVRYVLFKSPGNYLIVQVTGLNNDKALEEKIIRSVVY